MSNESKDRLLDAPEIYYRLRECISVLQMNNEELAEKFGISRAYIQKILTGKAAISGSAIATHQLPATASESSSEAVDCLRLLAL